MNITGRVLTETEIFFSGCVVLTLFAGEVTIHPGDYCSTDLSAGPDWIVVDEAQE